MRNKIGLNFVLLFILLINFIFTTENWHFIKFIPLQGAPKNFTFFYIAFILLFIYFLVSLSNIEEKKKYYLKLSIIVFLILFTLFSTLLYQIILRYQGADIHFVHDGAIGTEEATKFLSQGKNPYSADYRETPFGQFIDTYSQRKRDNPAWDHYIYLPFLSLFSLPFYLIFNSSINFFDQRIIYGLLFLASLFIIYKLPEEREKKIMGIILFAFNPLFFPYFFNGYNDIFVFFWLILSIYLLKIKKYSWSAIFLALACASKQSAWLILPFYGAYLYFQEEQVKILTQKIITVFKKLIPFITVLILIFIPFLIWGFNDFIDDVYRHPAGLIEANILMIGYGISHLIYQAGLVETIWDYFPFWILQAIFGLPLLYYLIKKQKENNTLSFLLINYGIFLLIFWFFSRFFNDNYISFLSLIFLSAYLIEEKSSLVKNEE